MEVFLKNVLVSIAFCLGLLIADSSAIGVGYPSALPNHDLGIEINQQPDRVIPKPDWFSAAVDGHVYLRALGGEDFYHGGGYLVQGRTEFRPHSTYNFNIRSIFYSGSNSGGYSEPAGHYFLFGFSGTWPGLILGGILDGRGIDLERQTIGNGLFIEEKKKRR